MPVTNLLFKNLLFYFLSSLFKLDRVLYDSISWFTNIRIRSKHPICAIVVYNRISISLLLLAFIYSLLLPGAALLLVPIWMAQITYQRFSFFVFRATVPAMIWLLTDIAIVLFTFLSNTLLFWLNLLFFKMRVQSLSDFSLLIYQSFFLILQLTKLVLKDLICTLYLIDLFLSMSRLSIQTIYLLEMLIYLSIKVKCFRHDAHVNSN